MIHHEQRDLPFLGTARATGACAREFVRLCDGLAEQAGAAFAETDHKITVRRSPERCIIQIGPSALTVAWLRTRRDSAEGELLVIHWRGLVAPGLRQKPELPGQPNLTAQALSEDVYLAEATSEKDWMWRSREEFARPHSSLSLAGLLVQHLRIAHDAASGFTS